MSGSAHATEIRARYGETDRGGVVYHATYLDWFEVARTEQLRALGVRYRDLEASGVRLVVVEASLRYRRPARYDDRIRVEARVEETTRVRIRHAYEVWRLPDDGEAEGPLVTGSTTLACLDPEGRPRRLPPELVAALDRTSPS